MSKSKMLSIRLDAALLRKVDLLCISRHRSRGQIIREAVELYFRAYNPTVKMTVIPPSTVTYAEDPLDPSQ
jgi:metal-responsive CopG/Arc/MetJ family transcriptional regulator